MTAVFAKADVAWSWWLENNSSADLSFGLASELSSVKTFELTLLYGGSKVDKGVQWSLWGINNSDSSCCLQLAPWFNHGDDPCVQLGMINVASEPVFTMGLANIADGAKFQLGFLNFNEKGFLPVFVFVNFDPSIFD